MREASQDVLCRGDEELRGKPGWMSMTTTAGFFTVGRVTVKPVGKVSRAPASWTKKKAKKKTQVIPADVLGKA